MKQDMEKVQIRIYNEEFTIKVKPGETMRIMEAERYANECVKLVLDKGIVSSQRAFAMALFQVSNTLQEALRELEEVSVKAKDNRSKKNERKKIEGIIKRIDLALSEIT